MSRTREYAVCQAAAGDDLRLFLTAPAGENIGDFDRLRDTLSVEGKMLEFAMNAGMYHPDRRPVGLFIADSQRQARLVTRAGPGNFGMLPNGVFCILADGFRVIETPAYRAHPPACRFATQSGPMLVIDGALHPRFRAESVSRFIRNGVGGQRRRAHRLFRDFRSARSASTASPGCSATRWACRTRCISTATCRASTRPKSAAPTAAWRWGRCWACCATAVDFAPGLAPHPALTAAARPG